MSVFSAFLPPGASGNWCRIRVRLPQGESGWWAKLEVADEARGHVVREVFLGRPRRRAGGLLERSVLVHLPYDSARLSLFVVGGKAAPGLKPADPLVFLRPLTRTQAAIGLLTGGWRKLPSALRGDRRGAIGRLRAVLGQAPARAGESPPYAVWIDLFDRWGEVEREELASHAAADISIEVALVAAEGETDALAGTLQSLPTQWRVHVIKEAGDWLCPQGDWTLVIGEGEVLAPRAGQCFLHAVRTMQGARGFCADLDHLDASGHRVHPQLRPPPDPWLLKTDFFSRGACLFHREAHGAVWRDLPAEADRARLALARAAAAGTWERVPLVLTHCPGAPRTYQPAPRLMPCAAPPMVSVIIPSACRSPHVLSCLRQLIGKTDYPAYEILLAVTNADPADQRQAAILAAASSLPHVRLVELALPAFNYAAVNNRAAAVAQGEWLLLLNDDVVPVESDWLGCMIAHVCGETASAADIVGVRLLYGNAMVQHGGVIMGLANLCEHAFRLSERGDAGPQGLAKLDRRVSAVTAACMLVRKSLFESLDGMDEAFAIALNDVDFCLRAGEAGASIVFAAGVELYHFESMSLGRHYQGTRAELEAMEVRRLRQRWGAEIAADKHYHPCASLELGREFQPGFPPRQTPLSWIRQEPLALNTNLRQQMQLRGVAKSAIPPAKG